MIRSFNDDEAEMIWNGGRSRKLPAEIQQRAFRRLQWIDAAVDLADLAVPPSNRLHALSDEREGQHSISINGVYVSFGATEARSMSRSPTITDPDWLENEHAGRLLATELMEPLTLSTTELASALQVPAEQLSAVIEGRTAMDAELDLRLSRYFGLSEGFFMRLQIRYELLEAKRALNGELDRIVPRAA